MKKLFEKAKLEIKFKKAGEGHALSEENRAGPSTASETPTARAVPVASAQKAGQVQ